VARRGSSRRKRIGSAGRITALSPIPMVQKKVKIF
jgi:hypothetical protein